MRPRFLFAAAIAAALGLGLGASGARAGILETGTIIRREANAKHGVNPSEIVTLRDASGREVRAIFKPAAGERLLSARGLLGLVHPGTR
jgi:hypothetical protein